MKRITIQSKELELSVLPFGARIIGLKFHGNELALAYSNEAEYVSDPYYLGATVGPIANRVANAILNIDGNALTLPANENQHCLHSGGVGFDQETWNLVEHSHDSAIFELDYHLAKLGMIGQLNVRAVYNLLGDTLVVEYHSMCDTDTYINPTNHVYLNLSGRSLAGHNASLDDHKFKLYGTSFAKVDEQNIPTGELTEFDSPLEYRLSKTDDFSGAVDHFFNVRNDVGDEDLGDARMADMVTAKSEHSGIEVSVRGNSVGYQFCTSDFLTEPFAPSGGFCVETQHAPNAINQVGVYSPLLCAGVKRVQVTEFKFSGGIF